MLPMSAYRADRAADVRTVQIDTFLAHEFVCSFIRRVSVATLLTSGYAAGHVSMTDTEY